MFENGNNVVTGIIEQCFDTKIEHQLINSGSYDNLSKLRLELSLKLLTATLNSTYSVLATDTQSEALF